MRRALLFGLLLGCWSGVMAQSSALDERRKSLYLRLCLDEAPHAPWRIPDADGRLRGQGLEFDFLRLLAEQSGWEFRVLLRPWRRCLQDIRTGQVDAILGISHTTERAAFVRFPMREGQPDPSLAVRLDHYALVAPQTVRLNWNGVQLEMPAGERIGVQAGYSGAQLLQKFGVQIDEGSRTVEGTLDRLLQGQVQAALVPRSEAQRLLRHRPQWAQRLQILEPPFPSRAYYLGVSFEFAGRHPGRLSDLWRDVALVRESVEFKRMVSQSSP